ncbi:MAG: bifunctional ADP-heptose synthase [Akkermansiaceae bacterium]|nr:bifunctional ADP-heptose synthase [Akkermansiaceae bacterium]MDP4645965.1 bifunctional ADP-heptose synthase [Akkermansiaceae bacterium]MDP4721833.1 bifunctional ADP-heptose synthase [Akkermansiaceae bacterium]MDP4781175.1 bifunctional ADP-heptose synthase [Akkermansiaceae bacterium]MDP4846522.1 bifunctional ADP-heptose synthase [Akkermansiaceae bacterium]
MAGDTAMTSAELLGKFPSLKILVVGDLMLDHYIWGDVHRISPEAPVPVVQAMRETHTAGGAANVALNLASLGLGVSVCGSLGEDEAGEKLCRLLEEKGIDAQGCFKIDGLSTMVKTRVVVRTQQLCRIDREAARSAYGIDAVAGSGELLEKLIAGCDAMILSDYAKGVITQELMDRCFALAAQHGKLLAVDPKPARMLKFQRAGLMTPNRHEALELAGIPEPSLGEEYPLEAVCRNIHAKYSPELLVVTLGADGMVVSKEGKVIEVLQTSAREVFDVSGAGDTVIATLTCALAAGASPVDAAKFANLAAGVVVSKVGTATVSPDEIKQAAMKADIS